MRPRPSPTRNRCGPFLCCPEITALLGPRLQPRIEADSLTNRKLLVFADSMLEGADGANKLSP